MGKAEQFIIHWYTNDAQLRVRTYYTEKAAQSNAEVRANQIGRSVKVIHKRHMWSDQIGKWYWKQIDKWTVSPNQPNQLVQNKLW